MSEKDNGRVAERIQATLNQKLPDGSYRWQKREVRDFIVACSLELGLGIPAPLEKTFLEFLAEIEVAADAPPDALGEAIREYFVATPLPPELLRQVNELARSELRGDRDDFDEVERLARDAARLKGTGAKESARAPVVEEKRPTARPPRRGLT